MPTESRKSSGEESPPRRSSSWRRQRIKLQPEADPNPTRWKLYPWNSQLRPRMSPTRTDMQRLPIFDNQNAHRHCEEEDAEHRELVLHGLYRSSSCLPRKRPPGGSRPRTLSWESACDAMDATTGPWNPGIFGNTHKIWET